MSSARSGKERADEKLRRKELGLPVRGDADAGRFKTPYPPRGGRNSGGRGKVREKKREPQVQDPAPGDGFAGTAGSTGQ